MSPSSRRLFVLPLLLIGALLLAVAAAGAQSPPDALNPMEELGKALYFDEDLSAKKNQSCATCHDPAWGFTGPLSEVNAHGSVYPGSLPNRFGNRKPPTAAYAGESPILFYDTFDEVFVGGMFWDGRATGEVLGDPVAEQAKGPFLNPLEQALPNAQVLCGRVLKADYADLYEQVWGEPINCEDEWHVAIVYDRIGLSISAFEHSAEVNPFSSKYDAFLAGQATLTPLEMQGLALFEGAAMCSACHPSEAGPNEEPPLFTDFTYDNLGVPKNPENPFYDMPPVYNPAGADWIDLGLGGFLNDPDEYGKHKVPTLRNVDRRPSGEVKAYGHNGFFKSLEEIVHFYNTRDVETWPAPEVPENVNTDELGNLGLTADEEAALVAFMKTLSDGWWTP
jgi:cytochrome c peroxidase